MSFFIINIFTFENKNQNHQCSQNYVFVYLGSRQILNRATVPDLQAMFFDQMKSSCFSITTDRSNNQGLEKNEPRHRTLILHTCVHQSHQHLLPFLIPLMWTIIKNGVTWDNYVSLTAILAVNNTSVNIG